MDEILRNPLPNPPPRRGREENISSPVEGGTVVYIGLGSNLGNRQNNILQAVDRLNASDGIRVLKLSSLTESKPVGPVIHQPDFINAVVCAETSLSPWTLLDHLLTIETQLGRVRRERWGPRIIDLDILFYGDQEINDTRLVVPHPEIENRSFVLAGLEELGIDLSKTKKGLVQ